MIVARQGANSLQGRFIRFRRMAPDLQQRQHQRGEFVAKRQTGEGHADLAIGPLYAEGRDTRVMAVLGQADLVRLAGNIIQKFHQFGGSGAVINRRAQHDRLDQMLQIGRKLGLEVCVQHDGLFR